MFKHEEHLLMAARLVMVDEELGAVTDAILKGYGKSSSIFKSAIVASERLAKVRVRMNTVYLKERSALLEKLPENLWKEFPNDIYYDHAKGDGKVPEKNTTISDE